MKLVETILWFRSSSHDSVNNGDWFIGTEGNAPSNSNCHLFIKCPT